MNLAILTYVLSPLRNKPRLLIYVNRIIAGARKANMDIYIYTINVQFLKDLNKLVLKVTPPLRLL